MYLGKIVEITDSGELYANAKHPYSQALLSAIPSLDPVKKSERIILQGDVPSPAQVPPGCAFHTRCPHAIPVCREQQPELKEVAAKHRVSCWLYDR
jgi:oligopeptide transport system ATP-binding protein